MWPTGTDHTVVMRSKREKRTLFASNDRFIRFGTVAICKAICPELSNCSYRPKTYRVIRSGGSRK